MKWLILSWALTFGYVPSQVELVQGFQASLHEGFPATTASLEVRGLVLGCLELQGGMKSYQYMLDGLGGFAPYRLDYTFKAELKAEGVALGFRHECDHPVISGLEMPYGSVISEVYVRIGF